MFLAFIRYFSLKLVSSDISPPFLCDDLEFWMIKVDVLVFFKDLGVWIETYNLFCYIYGEKINCILDTNYDQRRVRNGNFIFKKTSTTYFGFVFFFLSNFKLSSVQFPIFLYIFPTLIPLNLKRDILKTCISKKFTTFS